MRIACLAGPVTVAILAIFVLTGVAGYRGGWLWAMAIAAPAMAAVGWWGWGEGRGRPAAAITVAVGGMLFGLWNSQEASLSHGRLRSAMNSITVPPNFEHSGDTPGGWSLCFDECPSYTREWIVAGEAVEVRVQLRELFEAEGFLLEQWGAGQAQGRDMFEGHRGRLRVLVSVDTERGWKDGKLVVLALGQVAIAATLQTYNGD